MNTETKYFSPIEAKNTLPLVKKIVKDIIETSREMRLLAEDIGKDVEDDERIKKMAANIDAFMRELEEIGCFFKDWNFNIGLVDFPGLIDGEEVYLCWKSDEDDIKYYHRLEEGFSGRKPIPGEYFEPQ